MVYHRNDAVFGGYGGITMYLQNYKPVKCRWALRQRHGGVLAFGSIRHDSPRKRLASRQSCVRQDGSWLKEKKNRQKLAVFVGVSGVAAGVLRTAQRCLLGVHGKL